MAIILSWLKCNMHKPLIFLFFIFSTVSIGFAKPPAWFAKFKEVQVFQTDRASLERKFEPIKIVWETKLPFKTAVAYKVSAGLLRANYSNGSCADNKESNWDLAEGVVIDISFRPDELIRPSKLGIDLKNFKLVESYDTPNFIYSNDRLGIEYVLWLDKKVGLISYYPNAEKKQDLSCLKK